MGSQQSWSGHIPDDVLINILVKMPARSVLALKFVCKHWRGIIQNPSFIGLHLNSCRRPMIHNDNPPPPPPSIMIMRSSSWIPGFSFNKYDLISLFDDHENHPLYETSNCVPSVDNKSSRLVGPCDGLFLVNGRLTNTLVVFNPATKKLWIVPPSPILKTLCDQHDRSVGLGFDSVSNEYKVALFITCYNYSAKIVQLNEGPTYTVEIFSLTTNRWREVENIVVPYDDESLKGVCLFLNGAFHWLRACYWLGRYEILVFDLNKESFKCFKLPFGFTKDTSIIDDMPYSYLSVLNESLALIVHRKKNYGVSGKFDIWVMRDYGIYESWSILLYKFNIDDMCIMKPLSFGKDGEFFLEDSNHQLVSFDLNTKAIKEFQVYNPEYAFRYRETLISPNQ